MKSFVITSFAVLFPIVLIASGINRKNIKHQINEVIIFQQQAQLFHTASVRLAVGTHRLVFQKITPFANPNTLQLSGKGDGTLSVIRMQYDFSDRAEKSQELLQLQDTLKNLRNQLREVIDRIDVLSKEEQFLLTAIKPVPDKSWMTTDEFNKFSLYFRNKLTDIKYSLRQMQDKQNLLQERIALSDGELKQTTSIVDRTFQEIEVEVVCAQEGVFTFKFDYLTSAAGWRPAYDLRINPTLNYAYLVSKAMITQQTGVDWKDVKVILSTRRPTSSSQLLHPVDWYLNVYNPRVMRDSYSLKKGGQPNKQSGAPFASMMEAEEAPQTELQRPNSTVAETTLSIEYEIAGMRQILDKPNEEQFDIKQYELPYLKRYKCYPMQSEVVFLTALITGWEKLNLLPGEANVFFDGTYTSKSFINPLITSDTLTIVLGNDPQIICKRKEESKSGIRMLGTLKEITRHYQISFRNTRSFEAEIVVVDQFPRSQHEDIQVELTEWEGAEINKELGLLEWKLKLEPSKTITKSFGFKVKYKKDIQVSGL